MKIGMIGPDFIGAKLRKSHWTDCYIRVVDVGWHFVIGQVIEGLDDTVIALDLFPKDDCDWELYVDATKVIDMLPIGRGVRVNGRKNRS